MSREHARDDSKANARNRGGPEPAQADQPSRGAPPQAQLLLSLQPSAGNRAVSGVAQRLRKPESAPRPNDTGLPDGLKSGIEALSGVSLDDVSVHYNSDRPGQLDALALRKAPRSTFRPDRNGIWRTRRGTSCSSRKVECSRRRSSRAASRSTTMTRWSTRRTRWARVRRRGAQPVQRRPQGALSGGLAPVQRILAHDRLISAGEVKEVDASQRRSSSTS